MATLQRKSSGRMASKGFPNPIDIEMGAIIRKHRITRGISQEALGEAIGLTFQQVQKYERGANRISVSRLVDLSNGLGVSPGELLAEIRPAVLKQSPAQILGQKPPKVIEPLEQQDRATLEISRILAGYTNAKRNAVLKMLRTMDKAEGTE